MGATPAVPSLGVQTASLPGLDEVIKNAESTINAPLPQQYVSQNTPNQPHVQQPQQYQQQDTNRQPLNNQATSLKQARRQNRFAAVANAVGQTSNLINKEKSDRLQTHITNVMKAQQNIANAQTVLQTDPNNALAKQVLEANKTQMDSILKDDKVRKQIGKAFDISFTDPSKNKTPEVGAMIAATKEMKEAGPYQYDNPGEAKLAQQADASGQHQEGGNSAPPAQGAQSGAPQQQQAKSAATYSDQFLSKGTAPSLVQNPQYSAGVAQRQQAIKDYNEKIVPEFIKSQVQAAKDGNANARAGLIAATALQKDLADNLNKAQIADTTMSGRIKEANIKASQEYATAKLRADAARYVADKRLEGVKDKDATTSGGLTQAFTGDQKAVDQNILKYSTMVQNGKNAIENLKKAGSDTKTAELIQKNNEAILGKYQDLKKDWLGIMNPEPEKAQPSPEQKSLVSKAADLLRAPLEGMAAMIDGDKKDGDSGSTRAVEQVGAGESDEPASYGDDADDAEQDRELNELLQ